MKCAQPPFLLLFINWKTPILLIFGQKSNILLYKYSFFPYLKKFWVLIGIKTAPGDHESEEEKIFFLLTNLFLYLKKTLKDQTIIVEKYRNNHYKFF